MNAKVDVTGASDVSRFHIFKLSSKQNEYSGKFNKEEMDIDEIIHDKIKEIMATILNCGMRRKLSQEEFKITIHSGENIVKVNVEAEFEFLDEDIDDAMKKTNEIMSDLKDETSDKFANVILIHKTQIIGAVRSIMQQKLQEMNSSFFKQLHLNSIETDLNNNQTLDGGKIVAKMKGNFQLRNIKA